VRLLTARKRASKMTFLKPFFVAASVSIGENFGRSVKKGVRLWNLEFGILS
jgi:hypothetical protein